MGTFDNSPFSTTVSYIFQFSEVSLVNSLVHFFPEFSIHTYTTHSTHTFRHTYRHIPQIHTNTDTYGDIPLGWLEAGLDSPDLSSRALCQN